MYVYLYTVLFCSDDWFFKTFKSFLKITNKMYLKKCSFAFTYKYKIISIKCLRVPMLYAHISQICCFGWRFIGFAAAQRFNKSIANSYEMKWFCEVKQHKQKKKKSNTKLISP